MLSVAALTANVWPAGSSAPPSIPVTSAAELHRGPYTRAIIRPMQASVIAGEGVEVNGLKSLLKVGSPLTAQYDWDFGDPSGSYNTLTGWNAAHVYDTPGTYTVTLTVTDESGQSSLATAQVSVAADTRPVIYVDTNGSDANSGASPDQAVQTPMRALQLAASNTIVAFQRGETFDVGSILVIRGHDVRIGAYGSGPNPVLNRLPGNGAAILMPSTRSSNVTIEDLAFDSPNAVSSGVANKVGVVGVWAAGSNLVVRHDTFLNVDDAINGSIQPTGVIVQDNTAPLFKGLRGYFCWVDGTDWTILGNNVANTTREHDIRSSSMVTDRVLIADNYLSNPTDPNDPGEVVKTTINFREGRDIYVTGNTLNDAAVAMGPGPWTPDTDEVAWVKIDGNYMHQAQIYLAGAVHHALVSNNLLDLENTAQIHLRPDDPDFATRHMTDVTITNNTGISNARLGQFLDVSGVGLPGQIIVTNNLFMAPRLLAGSYGTGAVTVEGSDLSEFSLISDNVWPVLTWRNRNAPGPVNYVAGTVVPTGYLSNDQWLALIQVQGDQFANVVLPDDLYQITLNGVTAGLGTLF